MPSTVPGLRRMGRSTGPGLKGSPDDRTLREGVQTSDTGSPLATPGDFATGGSCHGPCIIRKSRVNNLLELLSFLLTLLSALLLSNESNW